MRVGWQRAVRVAALSAAVLTSGFRFGHPDLTPRERYYFGMRIRRASVACAGALLLILPTQAPLLAWGVQGHRLVARVAESRLTPAARKATAWLLDGRSLADVASWADDIRDANQQTGFWHYLNIPPTATGYDRDRDCPRQPGVAAGARADRWRDCAVDRILYSRERLADTSLDRPDRATALKYLVHFIGDLHQPFHALGVEQGGNGILVSVFGSDNCGNDPARPSPCNLHSVWDSRLIARRALNDAQYLASLEATIKQHVLNARPIGTPDLWAVESFRLARAALVPQKADIDHASYTRHIPVIDERLALAGLRLASVLNNALK